MYKGSYEDLKRLKRMKKENFLYAAIIIGSIDQVENVLEGDEWICVKEWKEWQKGLEKKVGLKELLKENWKKNKIR
jgi:hypothetical protein